MDVAAKEAATVAARDPAATFPATATATCRAA